MIVLMLLTDAMLSQPIGRPGLNCFVQLEKDCQYEDGTTVAMCSSEEHSNPFLWCSPPSLRLSLCKEILTVAHVTLLSSSHSELGRKMDHLAASLVTVVALWSG